MKPCKKHPSSARYKDGSCAECRRAHQATYYTTHKAEQAAYRAAHKTEVAAYQAAYRAAHKTEIAACRTLHKAEQAAYSLKYQHTHPEKIAAQTAKRRATKLNATPQFSAAEVKQIKNIYTAAHNLSQLCGECYQVDHIVALTKGGKHHPSNLRVLRGVDNLKKRARPADEVPVAFELRNIMPHHALLHLQTKRKGTTE